MGQLVQQEEWRRQGRRVGKMALIKFQLFAGQITRAVCQADVLLQWRREGWLASPATEGHCSCRPEPATDAPGAVPRCLPAQSCRTPSTCLQSLLYYSGGGRKRSRERGREKECERDTPPHLSFISLLNGLKYLSGLRAAPARNREGGGVGWGELRQGDR